jgi:ribosomal protein S12 methylthiotransferase
MAAIAAIVYDAGLRFPMKRNNKPIQSVAFVSLGCPKNLVDSERMLGLLAGDGLAVTGDTEAADAIVINTCGFLEASKTESMKEIHEAIRLKTEGKCRRVVVAGCLVQRHKTKLLADAPGIDKLVGVFDREHIVDAVRGGDIPGEQSQYLGKYHPLAQSVFEDDRARLRLTPRHYAYLRISEGCNQGCAFCTIPSIRGPMRSKPIKRILEEAKELAADGAVELNLIGQDTTSYGEDINEPGGLSAMLKALDRQLTDVHWLRLMYAYPSCFTDEMIHAIADCDRVVKYIDMPLQHINDEILTKMKRRVTRKQIETLLDKLRKWIPGISIRTTLIAGSPGETQKQHAELVSFVRNYHFDMLGVFPYSPEPGTAMGRMEGQLTDEVKQQRVEELMLAQQEVAFARALDAVGTKVRVLIDRREESDGVYVGRTTAQAPDIDSVTIVKGKDLHAGQLVDAKITATRGYDLIAQVHTASRNRLKVVSA